MKHETHYTRALTLYVNLERKNSKNLNINPEATAI